MTRYIFQVGKRVTNDCVTKEHRIGSPVDVVASCLTEARQQAASKIIVRSENYRVDWLNPADNYALWLKSQAQGWDSGHKQFFWFYELTKVLN